MQPKFILAGLGNPGSEYTATRHNVGFAVVDEIARKHRVRFSPGQGDFWEAACTIGDNDVLLLKPTTSMNLSGIAVADVLERSSLPSDKLLIIVDDFQLPLGALRLRPSGSDGGHNGLGSVIYQLRSDDFPRLRCGIGGASMPEDKELIVEFVLSSFTKEEQLAVSTMVGLAADAGESFVRDGLQMAMNRFNTPRAQKSDDDMSEIAE